MRKISYYLILIVIAGSALVSFWIYQKYFKGEESNLLLFKVEQGSIQEVIRVRGQVAAQKEFDLAFPFAGTVQEILVSQGQEVKQGDALAKLETTDFELELQKFQSQLKQSMANVESAKANLAKYQAALVREQAKLAELKQGARVEEIQIAETKVLNAQKVLEDAQVNLESVLLVSQTKLSKAQQSYRDAQINLNNVRDQAEIDLANLYGDVIYTSFEAYTAADQAVNKQVKDLFDKSGSSYKSISSTCIKA